MPTSRFVVAFCLLFLGCVVLPFFQGLAGLCWGPALILANRRREREPRSSWRDGLLAFASLVLAVGLVVASHLVPAFARGDIQRHSLTAVAMWLLLTAGLARRWQIERDKAS